MNSYGGRNKGPEHVDHQGGFAAAAEAYSQEMPWMYALPTTFAIRLDTFCDLVPVMVDPMSFVVDPMAFVVDPMAFMIVEEIFMAGVFHLGVVELDILLRGSSSLILAPMSTQHNESITSSKK